MLYAVASANNISLKKDLYESVSSFVTFLSTAGLEELRVKINTHCNVQPRQATANPVGGKACSSTIFSNKTAHLIRIIHIFWCRGVPWGPMRCRGVTWGDVG